MTFKNNRAPLLSNIKLCASFHRHMWIQTGVTVTAKWGHDLCDIDLWPLTLTLCMDITSINGNNSCKFQDGTMMGTWWKRCDGRTDGQAERSVLLKMTSTAKEKCNTKVYSSRGFLVTDIHVHGRQIYISGNFIQIIIKILQFLIREQCILKYRL